MKGKILTAVAALATIPAFIFGNLSANQSDTVNTIVSEQAAKTKYVQVLEGNKMPDDSTQKLTSKLPDNVSVNTHSGPEGEGYSIVTKTATQIISIGVGAYAQENTWVKNIDTKTATSS